VACLLRTGGNLSFSALAFIEFDCVIATTAGVKLVTLEGLGLEQHGSALLTAPTQSYDLVYTPTGLTIARTVPDNLGQTIDESSSSIFTYKRGEEILVQQQFGELQTWNHQTVWFIETANDAGALGFTRSLRREYTGWTIKLVVFNESWTAEERDIAMRQLRSMTDQLEDEIVIDAGGRVCVPRLTATDGPSNDVTFEPSRAWAFKNGSVVHVDRPVIPEDDDSRIVVELLAVSEGAGDLREFVGRDIHSQQVLMGLTNGPVSNVAIVSREACIEVSDAAAEAQDVPPFLAVAIAALALGQGAFVKPARLRSLFQDAPVVITHAETALGRALCQIFNALRVKITALNSGADLSILDSCHASVVLSAYEDVTSNSVLAAALRPNGRFFAWKDATTGVASALASEPWLIGDALRYATDTRLLAKTSNVSVASPLSLLTETPAPGQAVPSERQLFDAGKAYVLIGGVGSLGIDTAWWLYEARSSRSQHARYADVPCSTALATLSSLRETAVRSSWSVATPRRSKCSRTSRASPTSMYVSDYTFDAPGS
jgi:hypothetical protein